MSRRDVNIVEMSEDERREYDRQRQADYRERKRQAIEQGAAAPNEQMTRDLLADIAIAMLATQAAGHETIIQGLNRYYAGGGAGWPLQIIRKARTGKLKPKVLGKGRFV